MRISDWSSDVCSSDLVAHRVGSYSERSSRFCRSPPCGRPVCPACCLPATGRQATGRPSERIASRGDAWLQGNRLPGARRGTTPETAQTHRDTQPQIVTERNNEVTGRTVERLRQQE